MARPESPTTGPVRWGVLSTSSTAIKKVIPAMRCCDHARLDAIASRDRTRAVRAAEELGIPRVHDGYDALLTDPEIDAVYVPLPNSLHAEYTMRAAAAGKHVLCEKPAATSAAAAKRMTDACLEADVLFMEGFMYRFLPQTAALLNTVHEEAAGKIRQIAITMAFSLGPSHSRIRLKRSTEGGALADLGAYCIDLACLLLDVRPDRVFCAARREPGGEVETGFAAVVHYPGNVLVVMDGGFDRVRQSSVEIATTEAVVTASPVFMAGKAQLRTNRGQEEDAIRCFEAVDPFQLQIEHFSECVLSGRAPLVSIAETRRTAAVLEALRASANTAMPVAVKRDRE